MNDNRKIWLGIISLMAMLMTAFSLNCRPSAFWIVSHAFWLLGSCLFAGMALFVRDFRRLRVFALPTASVAIGMLCYTMFRRECVAQGAVSSANGVMSVLMIVISTLSLICLLWTVIDISLDLPFCAWTHLCLWVCFGLLTVVGCLDFVFALVDGGTFPTELFAFLATVLPLGATVAFFFLYTAPRRKMMRDYRQQHDGNIQH